MANFEIVYEKGDQIPDTKDLGGTANCNEGFRVTGGGFSSANLNITVSGPLDENLQIINNGWRVEGTPYGEGAPWLLIYAICVQAAE